MHVDFNRRCGDYKWQWLLVNSWLINGLCLVTINVDFSTIFTHDSKIGHSKVSEWHDIRPSMVTHTRNLCSALTHPKCAHTAVSTHSSEQARTGNCGQPFMLWRPGSSWGFGALLKGTSVMVLRVERVLYIHSPHLQFLPARDLNSQPFDYESDYLTIRPWFLSQCTALFPLSISRKCG